MTQLKGIDVSKHQGTINWAKVKAAGIQFAIIRAGYGRNNIDSQFKRNISECNRLGIPCGVYWFSYALNEAEAKKEAEYCLAAIKPYKVEYPVYFDLEYDTARYMQEHGVRLTKAIATAHARAFLNVIEQAGYYAANYANPDYLSRFFDTSDNGTGRYDLWLANYKANPNLASPPRECGMWQYSSKGSVSGITGNVDMNVSYRDYPALIRKAGRNNLGTTEAKWTKTSKGWTYGDCKAEWLVYKDHKYYFNANGIAVTGLQLIDGKWYYFVTATEAKKTGLPECSMI